MALIMPHFFNVNRDGNTMQATNDRSRKEALYILRHGWLEIAEIAAIVNESRQTVRYWAQTAGFDYRRRRKAFLRTCAKRARNGTKKGN
jgi:hypothetical protein